MSHSVLGLQGTLLAYGATPTTVLGRVELEGPELERTAVKTTDLDTTVAHTYRGSALYEGGTLTGKLFYDPFDATNQHFQTAITSTTAEAWKVTYSDGSSFNFSGFVTKFKPMESVEAGDEDNLQASFEIKVSGGVTFTPHV